MMLVRRLTTMDDKPKPKRQTAAQKAYTAQLKRDVAELQREAHEYLMQQLSWHRETPFEEMDDDRH